MGEIHDLIETQGRKGALERGIDRAVVEAAAAYLSDEDSGLGFAYSGWAQCALPHKRLPEDAPWGIVSDKVKLMVEPSRLPSFMSSALPELWPPRLYGIYPHLHGRLRHCRTPGRSFAPFGPR